MAAATEITTVRCAVLDDDSGFLQVLGKRMDALGWQARVLRGPVPVDALVEQRLHALIVDPVLLGPGAWEWLERVCSQLPGLAIIVCTGPSSVGQRVRGLRLGVDDWMTKPCHPEELIVRVEAVVRRGRRASLPAPVAALTAGELDIRPERFQAFVGERSLDLTRREFELIHLLATAEGQVLPREEIYRRVWGYAMAHGDRSVDVFVRKLRQKLERHSPSWVYIHTQFGIGYRFAPELAGAPEETAPPPPPISHDHPAEFAQAR